MYACAFLARQRPDFVEKYGIHVDSLMYDVAHSGHIDSHTTGGAYFPFTRHKSWFDSHSFASGLFPFSDGKSQESSSEAVNCDYGAYLWSSVRWGNVDDGDERVNFARLLLATEVRGTRTYWHMLSPQDADSSDSVHAKEIYPESFTKDLMVGNVGMTDVLVTTWFGNKMLYVHMINFMPVTEITRELFPQDYVEKEFNDILRPTYDDIESVWKGYVVADRAIIEPNEAWEDAIKLKSNDLDGALSLSQLYYWISTQEGFSGSAPSDYDEHAFCEMNKGCADLGLHGECCPTATGIKLGCCD
jgi:endo-1,3(4)-beta-glucanase